MAPRHAPRSRVLGGGVEPGLFAARARPTGRSNRTISAGAPPEARLRGGVSEPRLGQDRAGPDDRGRVALPAGARDQAEARSGACRSGDCTRRARPNGRGSRAPTSGSRAQSWLGGGPQQPGGAPRAKWPSPGSGRRVLRGGAHRSNLCERSEQSGLGNGADGTAARGRGPLPGRDTRQAHLSRCPGQSSGSPAPTGEVERDYRSSFRISRIASDGTSGTIRKEPISGASTKDVRPSRVFLSRESASITLVGSTCKHVTGKPTAASRRSWRLAVAGLQIPRRSASLDSATTPRETASPWTQRRKP